MRLTQESQGMITSSSAHAAPATAMLQPGPLRRKISLELKAWEDSLAAAAGNTSFSSFNKDDEENDNSSDDFAEESSSSTDDDDQLVVRQKKKNNTRSSISSKNPKSSKKTKKAIKIISRKNADGSIIKKEKTQQNSSNSSNKKQQQQQQPREQEQPLSPPKSVSFRPRVRIRRIKCLDDTDDETIYNMYYSPEELDDIRDGLRESLRSYLYSSSSSSSDYNTDIRSVESEDDEVEDTVALMVDDDHDDDSDDDSFCLRGLENELPENKQRRRLTKATARKAVLQEQERQRQDGYNDMYQLSFVYKRHVASSVQSAFLAASRDAWDAKQILEEEKTSYSEPHCFEDITVHF